jgi:RimJ/RimL family protein N-acetyltransferase
MLKLQGRRLYLAALEREHCRKLFENEEYDFSQVAEPLYIGASIESADEWYADIQKRYSNNENIRLGIFLNDGTVIGDVALQEFDWRNRNCSLGLGIAKLEHRSQGYGKEASALMLVYAFENLGLHRVAAYTLDTNEAGKKCLKKLGFKQEGRKRQDRWIAGQWVDMLQFSILSEEWR